MVGMVCSGCLLFSSAFSLFAVLIPKIPIFDHITVDFYNWIIHKEMFRTYYSPGNFGLNIRFFNWCDVLWLVWGVWIPGWSVCRWSPSMGGHMSLVNACVPTLITFTLRFRRKLKLKSSSSSPSGWIMFSATFKNNAIQVWTSKQCHW